VVVRETGRPPLDFAEGESELVRGFNTEFSRAPFVLLFLGEYGRVLFLSCLSSVLFVGGGVAFSVLIVGSILFLRGVFPRFRYDFLMRLVWFKILPLRVVLVVLGSRIRF
jgi:NADH:ubiquinone oxidoreductase subunit H